MATSQHQPQGPSTSAMEPSHSSASNAANFNNTQNYGLQVGQNLGVINYYHSEPDYEGSYFRGARSPLPNFVPRDALQEKIAAQLHSTKDDREHKLLVISGLGGAGKSQLALAYLHEHRKNYRATFWIEASSNASIEVDFKRIFPLLFPSQQAPSDRDTLISMIHSRLQGDTGLVLLVFDGSDAVENEEDPEAIDLELFLPRLPGVHLIVTTRISTVAGLSSLHPVQVKEMGDEEALALFQKFSGVSNQVEDARMIVRELGNFALAIALAGSHIKQDYEMARCISRYLKKHQQFKTLYRKPERFVHQYSKTIQAAWDVSYEAIEKRSGEAARLLTCLSFLDPTDIFLDMFRVKVASDENEEPGDELLPSWKEAFSLPANANIETLKESFDILIAYSLVDLGIDKHSAAQYSMHKLAWVWGFYRLELAKREKYCVRTLAALKASIKVSPTDWTYQERLTPHLVTNFNLLQGVFSAPTQEHIHILQNVDSFDEPLEQRGKASELCKIREYLHNGYDALLGADHPDTLLAKEKFANSLSERGQFDRAVIMHKEVLNKRRELFGDDDPTTLLATRNLAAALYFQGHLKEAAELQRMVLEVNERTIGREDLRTLSAMENLALTLKSLGNLTEAKELQQEALDKKTQILGPDHLVTVLAMGNLAVTLSLQGDHQRSLELQKEVLNKRRELLGDAHPDTLDAKMNIASVLSDNGMLEDAAFLEAEVLKEREVTLGPEHPDTMRVMGNLAVSMQSLGKLDDAYYLQQTVFEREIRVFGRRHPVTLTTMGNLGTLLESRGQLTAAGELKQEVFETRRLILGEDHSDTIAAEGSLAITLGSLTHGQDALERSRRVFGVQHKTTIICMIGLAHILHGQGRFSDAAVLKQEVLNQYRVIYGYEHPETLSGASNLAATLCELGEFDKARSLQEDTLSLKRKVLGEDHLETFQEISNLALTLGKMGDLQASMLLEEEAVEKSQQILGEDSPDTLMAMENLATTLSERGDLRKAISLRRRVLKKRQKLLGLEHPGTLEAMYKLAISLSKQGEFQ